MKEFRGIVWDKKLIGISQYNQDAYFPHLKILKSRLELLMRDFFHDKLETIVQKKFPYCVIDFAITRKNEELGFTEENVGKIYIIELNAAWHGTGKEK